MIFKSFTKGKLDEASVEKAFSKIKDPILQQDYLSLGAIQSISVDDTKLMVQIGIGYPFASIKEDLESTIKGQLSELLTVDDISLTLESSINGGAVEKTQSLAQVKNIIAVGSGKGGVGKSTTSINLALALSAEGAKVGILDADIYGPSQPQMLGVGKREPQIIDNKYMVPIEAHGLKSISMGYLVTDKTPMVWRGPMVSSAFQQLVNQTFWGELDYLVIDMPPGTGDIQLTLSQSVPVSGAVIVTTPQDIALLDAKKGIEMFQKVNVPVLGVVENMATHICTQCGHEEHIFGEGGGERIAKEYKTPLLGALPLDLTIRKDADGGKPSVVADPNSTISDVYKQIARRVGAQLWHINNNAVATPEIIMTDD
ncbi:MAG: iron-sulfur cluster carrier protein ApbC [Cellvibrionaceae bacterium]